MATSGEIPWPPAVRTRWPLTLSALSGALMQSATAFVESRFARGAGAQLASASAIRDASAAAVPDASVATNVLVRSPT